MSGSPLVEVAAAVAAIERGADMASMRRAVRAFASPLGYDRFVLYTAPTGGDGIVEQLLWMEGDWFGDGSEVAPETYLARCPVNRHVLETDCPFFWTKTGKAGEGTYRVVTHPRGPGIHGIQVPVFSHGRPCWCDELWRQYDRQQPRGATGVIVSRGFGVSRRTAASWIRPVSTHHAPVDARTGSHSLDRVWATAAGCCIASRPFRAHDRKPSAPHPQTPRRRQYGAGGARPGSDRTTDTLRLLSESTSCRVAETQLRYEEGGVADAVAA